MNRKHVKLKHVEVFVLDEADRMLDMGFIDDIRQVIRSLPKKRQTLMFSATIPQRIRSLADSLLTEPEEVRVTPETIAAETVEQTVYLVEAADKRALLEHLLKTDESMDRALVFTRTKRTADLVAAHLQAAGIATKAIHADKPQKARERALVHFQDGKTRVLVASDIASRGLDIEDISHVVNYNLPEEAEVYVHRIGRTGRAGQAGKAISLCALDERHYLDDVERLLDRPIPVITDHPFPSPLGRSSGQEEQDTGPRGWKLPSRRKLPARSRRRR
jgi:ATP-dependent RNA helicase RhlE